MITQGQTTIFKQTALNAVFGSGHVFKLALYTANATLNNTTTAYTTIDEVVGTGYTAGGAVLTVIPVASNDQANTAYVSFQTVVWNPASFTTRGGLIYDATTGVALAVLDFGSDKTTNTTFTVTFPADNPANAIIRIS